MIDLAAELREALERMGLVNQVREAVRVEVKRALAEQQADKLLPLAGLADLLGCSVTAAKQRVHRDDELARLATRVGRHRRWRRSDVLALLEARRAATSPP